MTGSWADWLGQVSGLPADVFGRILASALVLVVLWLLQAGITRIIQGRIEDIRVRYAWQKGSSYVFLILLVLFGAQIWLGGVQSIGTYLGLLTAGLAIVLRDLIVNFVGWVFILVSRPFTVGNRIQIGDVAGDVIDLRIFEFTLLEIGNWVDADQSTGRIIHVPNGWVFSRTVANYESGFRYIWNEIPVMLTLDSNWSRAKEMLQAIADRHAENITGSAEQQVREASRRFMIYYTNLTPTVYTSVQERGILMTIRYLCEPRQRRTTSSAIWEEILREVEASEDIHIAHI